MSEPTRISQTEIEAALREVGLQAGDVALVHSSLSSMGWVEGGADAVIDALLAVLDPTRGTLVLPTLCQKNIGARFETWDIATSPSDVGRITEVGRLRPDAIRSDHATHSGAASGADAAEITCDHGRAHGRPSPWGPAAFGIGSPWEKLYDRDAQYLFLGTTTSCNTIGHFAQAEFVRRTLASCGPRRDEFAARVKGWKTEGVWPAFGFVIVEEWLKEEDAMRYATVGDTTLRATRARVNVDTILDRLDREADAFVPEDFVEWLAQARQVAREQGADR